MLLAILRPQITPHILIFWRPDISSFVAYMLKPAAKDAKVARNVTMTLLPNVKGVLKGAEAFKLMSTELDDDSDAFDFLCPQQVRVWVEKSDTRSERCHKSVVFRLRRAYRFRRAMCHLRVPCSPLPRAQLC